MADLNVIGGQLKPSMELLSYYKDRLDAAESEREQYLQRLSEIEASSQNVAFKLSII
jgi:hypothetical protein